MQALPQTRGFFFSFFKIYFLPATWSLLQPRLTAGRERGGVVVRRRGVARVIESAVDSHTWGGGGVGQDKQRQGRAVWLVGAG